MTHQTHIADFVRSLPRHPYATDVTIAGCKPEPKGDALRRRHVQINRPTAWFWLVFDIDKQNSAEAWDEAMLPAPTFVAENPENRHAHMAWRIDPEVARLNCERMRPVRYLQAVERGYCRRLGADAGYAGFLVKNPLSPTWRTAWLATRPYALGDLARNLSAEDMRYVRKSELRQGVGRNVELFDTLRKIAYRDVLHLKRDGAQLSTFARCLGAEANGLNQTFDEPLHTSEVNGVVRSVSRWVWDRFSVEGFRAKQSYRGRRSGISRRQSAEERQEKVRTIYLDMVPQQVSGRIDALIGQQLGISAATIRYDIAKLRRDGKL